MKKKILSTIFLPLALAAFAQKKQNNIVKAFEYYNSQYTRLRNEGKTDSVFFISRQCYQLAQNGGNDTLLQRANNLLGNAFLIASDFGSALEYYFKALALAENMNDSLRIGATAGNISFTYYQLGNYNSGVEYGKKALNMLLLPPRYVKSDNSDVENKYYQSLAIAYDNTGVSYVGLNQPDSALQYLQSAYTTTVKANDQFTKVFVLTDLATAYALLKETRMADDNFKNAIYLSDSLKMLSALSYSANYYSKYLVDNGRFNEIKYFGRSGISAAIQSQDRMSVIDLAQMLQKAYDATGNKDSAYYFSMMVNNYRDTVFNTQKMLVVQNAVFNRQVDEKEAQLKDQKLAEERKHNLQYAAIALALVTIIISFFIFSHSIIANPKIIKFLGVVALLIVFEFINLYIHPFLSHVSNDSPLLMLLVMVCIAALLVPLHHRIEHWITHRLVEKNNKIRLASARKTIEQLEKKI